MKGKSLGFKIGAVLSALHLCLAVMAFIAMAKSHSSTSSLVFIWFFFLDAPLLLLIPASALKLFGVFAPLVQFGVIGSGLWFLIPWLIDKIISRFSQSRIVRSMIILGFIPLILFGFTRLGFFSTKLLIQGERPAELKNSLNKASTDFLTGKVIFEAPGIVSSISRKNCRPGAGTELLLVLPSEIVFLSDSYEVRHKLVFPDRFWTIEPLEADGIHACGFLAYRFMKNVYLLDPEGKEIWKSSLGDSNSGPLAGVNSGDIDGDGKPEFALYHSYRQGIELVDSYGKTRWKHPVYALGHLELADIRENGKSEIIYSNSNNVNGKTDFTILDAAGAVVSQQTISTTSSEFAIIKWPKRETIPNILLTEDGKIRIVDQKGSTVIQLDAPGCRTFGQVKAVTVKFAKEEPEYLAVRKSLHPDLSVLYVYDPDGTLVYQKTEVIEGVLPPALFAMPADYTGTERLLVGATQKFTGQVVEYSLTR